MIYNSIVKLTINKAGFNQQDITVYPDKNCKIPSNLNEVVSFLFGKDSYVELGRDLYPAAIIKGASFMLKDAHSINASWTVKEIEQVEDVSE